MLNNSSNSVAWRRQFRTLPLLGCCNNKDRGLTDDTWDVLPSPNVPVGEPWTGRTSWSSPEDAGTATAVTRLVCRLAVEVLIISAAPVSPFSSSAFVVFLLRLPPLPTPLASAIVRDQPNTALLQGRSVL
jgi:hypothetical protein